MNRPAKIAYFSMEIGLADALPTYSGGLGVLAGDTIRSAADGGVPLVAVTLVHRKGYFRQHLDPDGTQSETAVAWAPADLPESNGEDQHITDHLYGGDEHYRLRQEVLLGIGGVRMLRALGHTELARFPVLPEQRLEHDLPRAGQQHLHQRRGQTPRRDFAPQVRPVQGRLDHERRARWCLDRAR